MQLQICVTISLVSGVVHPICNLVWNGIPEGHNTSEKGETIIISFDKDLK